MINSDVIVMDHSAQGYEHMESQWMVTQLC